MDSIHEDSVSFGKELQSGDLDRQLSHESKITDRETMQLELVREMYKSKLNDLLSNGLSHMGSPGKHKLKSRSPIKTGPNTDDYYQLMRRCLEAEVLFW